jgi:hypothetical protein
MSRFSKAEQGWCAAVALLGVCITALGVSAAARAVEEPTRAVSIGARVGTEAPDEGKPAGGAMRSSEDKGEGAQSKAAVAKPPGSLFRCWQDGRLIFEGRGYGALPQSQVAADLRPADGASGRVQILDMYEGLCVLELPK